jgi:hypothetical protein
MSLPRPCKVQVEHVAPRTYMKINKMAPALWKYGSTPHEKEIFKKQA